MQLGSAAYRGNSQALELNRTGDLSANFVGGESKAPATFSKVVKAVTRLSKVSEVGNLELASSGAIKRWFPFRTQTVDQLPPDTVGESELEEASATIR